MKNITVNVQSMNVNSGQVKLSAEQAAVRRHALRAIDVNAKTGAGVYEVLQPIQFKRGESFGFDGEISKAGVLSDPAAEELARLEAEEKHAAQIKAAEQKGREAGAAEARAALIAELQTELGPVIKELPADVQAKLEAPFVKVFGDQAEAAK